MSHDTPKLPTPFSRISAKTAARELMAAAKAQGRRLTYTQALAELARANGYGNVHEMTSRYVTDPAIPSTTAVAETSPFKNPLHPEAKELQAYYGNAHSPLYPLTDWQYEVSNGDTKLDYWTWLAHRHESEATPPAPNHADIVAKAVADALRQNGIKTNSVALDLTTGCNTEVAYQYRDASNYKSYRRAVLPGRLTAAAIQKLIVMLDDGEFFIPGEIGLDDLQDSFVGCESYWDPEQDHPWHELLEVSYTSKRPTISLTADEVTTRIMALDAWNSAYEPDFAPLMHDRYQRRAAMSDEDVDREILNAARAAFPVLPPYKSE